MSKITRMMTAAVSGVLAAVSLQAAPLPGFYLAAQTEHFSFYSRDRQKVDAAKSEQFLVEVERLLGQQIQGRALYYRYSSPEQIEAGTGTWAQGVTFVQSGEIHTTEEFHAHEIVHLVAGQLGNPGAFFQEGLAVALGNRSKWYGKDVDKLAKAIAKSNRLAALVAGFERMDVQAAYPVAGSFVAALIKAHGIAKVADFFRACSGHTTTAAAFAATFGQTLDESGAAWARSL